MADPTAAVHAVYRAWQRRDLDEIVAQFDGEAAMRLFATNGETVRGLDAVRSVVAGMLDDADHTYTIDAAERLDGETALELGNVRYRDEHGGYIYRQAAWLWTVRGGKAVAMEAFDDERAAREAWQRRADPNESPGSVTR